MNIVPFAVQRIMALEAAIKALPEQVEPETVHTFGGGIYARTMRAKAGTVLTGKIHRNEHLFAVLQGSCTVVDSLGFRETVKAPYLGITKPGTKRAFHIHEDCVWTTFHVTELTDPDEIEREVIAESFEEFNK